MLERLGEKMKISIADEVYSICTKVALGFLIYKARYFEKGIRKREEGNQKVYFENGNIEWMDKKI